MLTEREATTWLTVLLRATPHGHAILKPFREALKLMGHALANAEEAPIRTHRFSAHTPEEMRRLSNLAHWLEGILLAAVGILALVGNIASWAGTTWPFLTLFAGLLLLIAIYPRHPRKDWPANWNDAQQRQHTLVATALALAGGAELLSRHTAAWTYVWPGVMLFIGVLFLSHPQHGTGAGMSRAVWLHRILGLTAIAAGLLRTAAIVTRVELFTVLWPIALLAAAAQLILYREPEGAYERAHADHA